MRGIKSMASGTEDLLSSLKRLYALQSERVETYTLFEEGFTAYLKGAPQYNFQMYKSLVNEITNTFNNISKDILKISKTFEEANRQDIVEIISKIQQFEQNKLKVTADHQVIRQDQIDYPDKDLTESSASHSERLSELIAEINDEMETLKYTAEDIYNAA